MHLRFRTLTRTLTRQSSTTSSCLGPFVSRRPRIFEPFSPPSDHKLTRTLGLAAEQGLGYVQLQFGERVGPNDNFEILRKLGWGSYSSVWLAKDIKADTYVAVKALTSNATALDARGILQEVEFTSSVTRFIKNCHHPTSYCTEYLSSFTHSDSVSQPGEVSEHLCLVLELCTSDVNRLWAQFPNRAMPALLAKKILRDVLHGLAQFHALNCIHTDLKAGNIFCKTSPESTRQTVQSFLQTNSFIFNPPERSLGSMVQSAKSQPLPTPNLAQALGATYILGDFGHAQYLGAQITPFISPELYRAPETIMLGPWGTPVDVRAFGCLAYELLCGVPPFSRVHPTIPSDHFHIAQMIKYVGEKFSVDALREYKQSSPYIDMTSGNFIGNPIIRNGILWERFNTLAGKKNAPKHDIDGAFALIEQCLRLNPADRPDVMKLLCTSSWLRELGPVDF